jgi:hypothetical protein
MSIKEFYLLALKKYNDEQYAKFITALMFNIPICYL